MENFEDEAALPKELVKKVKEQKEEDEMDSKKNKEMYSKIGERKIMSIAMNVDEEGNPLSIEQAQEKSKALMDSMLTGPLKGVSVNFDYRTNIDNMSKEEALHFLKHRIDHLRSAYAHWTGIGQPRNLSDPKMLLLYEELYQDMKANADEWDKFFENIRNTVWCERSVGIINTYATVMRQRAEADTVDEVQHNNLIKCESILNMGGKLLVRYKAMSYHPDSLSIAHFNDEVLVARNKECCRGLTFKYLLIKHNLLQMTNRFKYTNPNEGTKVYIMCFLLTRST